MNDRASMPPTHGVRLRNAMLCCDCQFIFDGSIWEECPTCASGIGLLVLPTIIATLETEDKTKEAGVAAPASQFRTN